MVFIVYFPITFRPEPLGYVIIPIITNGNMAKGFGACMDCDVYHGMDYDRTGGFGNQSGIVDRISIIDHRENAPGSDQVRDKIRKPSP